MSQTACVPSPRIRRADQRRRPFSGHGTSGAGHLDGPACPTRPELPPPLPPTGANGWSAIDHLSCLDCFLSPFKQLDEVPDAFTEAWALAMVDVHELFYSAPDGTTRTRALKWNLALHHMLLRAPIRGGRRGHNEIPKRFKAWADGNAAQLVRWWEADRAVVARSRRSTAAAGDTAFCNRPSLSSPVDSCRGPSDD